MKGLIFLTLLAALSLCSAFSPTTAKFGPTYGDAWNVQMFTELVKEGMKDSPEKPTRAEIEAEFALVDLDEDGVLSPEERNAYDGEVQASRFAFGGLGIFVAASAVGMVWAGALAVNECIEGWC